MSVDYIDLNKHCPKDPFPSHCIDQIVNSIAGASSSPSSTATSGTTRSPSFITPFGAYCDNTMMFGLKNVGATYQKAI
jgi:hypothetical protein